MEFEFRTQSIEIEIGCTAPTTIQSLQSCIVIFNVFLFLFVYVKKFAQLEFATDFRRIGTGLKKTCLKDMKGMCHMAILHPL